MDRRDVERGADVVEAVADVVGRERVGKTEIKPDQIADRVVVFLPVQPPNHDGRRLLGLTAFGCEVVVLDPVENRLELLKRRLGLVGRRHDPALQRRADLDPGLTRPDRACLIGIAVEDDSPLGIIL